ncbi:anaerobic ribonucleoside-triphosphate reductase activating protein [Ralstonia solanacearum]|uniref:anaerobic ribonucleoside-triphosphate reductase activating protein n=1 Tax=Ralstonia solanacearum TaxID=305 RepID=UPI0001D96805|nr:anaerobic ribonucleoside-triphosphate reductase activating protein [Ralstonia solanacearum]CBJ35835.1 putative ribonucleotide reductase activating transmembrane protein (nrdG) [Ralstonia solanacearum PSI07]
MNAASSLKNVPLDAPDRTPAQRAAASLSPLPFIGGLTPFSSVDWPGQLAAVVFIAGCPWRCHYCHNPHLQLRERRLHWTQVMAFLQRRRTLLDAVVFSGGEPLSEPRLPQLIAAVRELGFKAGLHTGGIYPARLAAVLPMLDWVGLDIKTTASRYDALTGRRGSAAPVATCLDQLLQSNCAFECRTTWHPDWLPEPELLELAQDMKQRGVKHFALQAYRSAPGALATVSPSDATKHALATCFTFFTCR